ncbi:prolyl oligopeptidase family serine peptidase [Verrucomicrobiales bacterium]|nr:prolyl oligopeptidase family serine peptidase [Verrucomicrobiales bacterium]
MRFWKTAGKLLGGAATALAFGLSFPAVVTAQDLERIPPIERRLPPVGGINLPDELKASLEARITAYEDRIWEVNRDPYVADVGALVKAVELAVKWGEFYKESEIPLAEEILNLADERYEELDQEEIPSWTKSRGLVVRGYESSIDESFQPYGLEVPENLDLSRSVPLLVWLHGRGDKVTDLHFLKRCMAKSQALGGFVKDQQECIILHPFGRQCIGWKHAGERDVFEAIEAVKRDYQIDDDRIALAGFSMGGAGAWHIGAHYPDQFCAVHAGAGFAETKEYNKLTPENYPAPYVQTLWKVYDVPFYTRNLLNIPVLAYSGSVDKQKQAADLIERELKSIGHELRHVIGAEMGHKYNQESVDEIWEWLQDSWEKGRVKMPKKIQWETPTLRYPGYQWLKLTGLQQHWSGAKAIAQWDSERHELTLDLENVSAFEAGGSAMGDLSNVSVIVNGQILKASDPGFALDFLTLKQEGDSWQWGELAGLRKRPGMQGPIDDAFMSHFVVVPPDSEIKSPALARWVNFEREHFMSRWEALMRGKAVEYGADDLDSGDIEAANLILWGNSGSNAMIAEIIDRLPIEWNEKEFTFRGKTYLCEDYVPSFIFPNPLNPKRYVVINSGLTFREGHDKTNSQQNPKLPDWAVIGLDQLPDEESPGRIVDTGFFDESWK